MVKSVHENFQEYVENIVSHPNYEGLPYTRDKQDHVNWVTATNSKLGKKRKEWALKKAKGLGIQSETNIYSKVMFALHPTKETVCQICGSSMSIRYIYPGQHFINKLEKDFDFIPNTFDSIYDVNDYLLKNEFKSEEELKGYYIKYLKLKINSEQYTLDELIDYIEELCRVDGKRTFSPGAMSNFPDRFDGYHSYNKCCRQKEDKGRHQDNMKSYNKDRRAYENWSDGNIHAANKFMNSLYFKGTSADHIGPISLGFVHDPRYLVRMSGSENSAKRNKLLLSDVQRLVEIEIRTGKPAMSWFGTVIWERIKELNSIKKLNNNLLHEYRELLLMNMQMYMEVMWYILNNTYKENQNMGEIFLIENYLNPKKEYFQHDYKFDEKGDIIDTKKRKITEATKKEYNRFIRISLQSIQDYHEKSNRRLNIDFSESNILRVKTLCKNIVNNPTSEANKVNFEEIIQFNQIELLENSKL